MSLSAAASGRSTSSKMIQDISADIDGDGEFTTNDLYGFITTPRLSERDSSTPPTSNINSDADTGLHLALMWKRRPSA